MAIAALVLGILGLVLSFVPCLGMYAMPLTILAIILGGLGMKKVQGKGMSIAGLVMGVIGTLIAGWWIYAYLSVKQGLKDGTYEKQANEMIKEAQEKQEKEAKEAGKPDPATPPPADPAPVPTGSAATP